MIQQSQHISQKLRITLSPNTDEQPIIKFNEIEREKGITVTHVSLAINAD